MNEKQREILEKLKETLKVLVTKANANRPDFSDFEYTYNNLMTQLSYFIENEEDDKMKSSYEWSYDSIKSYGENGKGVYGVQCDYEISIKKSASKISKRRFEVSLRNAADHIEYDFNNFFQQIPKDTIIDKLQNSMQ